MLKRCLLLGLACLAFLLSPAQDFEWSVGLEGGGIAPLQPSVVQLSDGEREKSFGGWQAGGSVRLQRWLSSNIGIAGQAGYFLSDNAFELPCMCAHTQDRVVVVTNDLRVHGLEMMASLQLRIDEVPHLYTWIGFGADFIVGGHRNVAYDIRFVGGYRPDTSMALLQEDYAIRTTKGSRVMPLFDLGVGYRFGMSQRYGLELFTRYDINEWAYEVTNLQGVTQEVCLRRKFFGLRAVFILGTGERTPPPVRP
ncbi:MAG TPA: hypothetical protein VKG92_00980 [Flavobacteriales bacterium]|nr:hypothetical protein [Flavobacteriales bacterium]